MMFDEPIYIIKKENGDFASVPVLSYEEACKIANKYPNSTIYAVDYIREVD